MRSDLKTAYESVVRVHQHVYGTLQQVRSESVQANDMTELVDMSYVCREIDRFLDDMGKEVRKLQALVDRIVCLKYIQDTDLGDESIQTEYCSAKPDIRSGVRFPEKDSPEYAQLLAYIGVPEGLRDMVRLSYQKMSDLVSDLEARGLPLPEGLRCENTFNDFRLHIRKKKGILDNG